MRKVLKGARIIDCVSSESLEGYKIIIKEDRILSVDKENEQELPGDELINLSGKTILPGLINMHVHLTADDKEDLMPDMLSKSDEQLLLQAVSASRLTLKSGVTTVRDCGSRNNLVHWLRDAINQGKLTGPRIISSGMPITITGGHCFYLGVEVDGTDEIRKVVRSLVKDGADFIKVMVTGGGSTPHTDKKAPSFTDQELYTAVNEAHCNGRKVAAHAHGTREIIQAVEVGVDTIEHCSFLTDNGMKAENHILELMKDREIIIVPTVSGGIRRVYDGSFTVNSFDKFAKGSLVDYFHERFSLFKALYKSGVNILAGNDSGIQGTPHDDFVSELEVMADLGMETKEVIETATCKAAYALGLESEIGTIEAGKKADLLVVEGDPLQDIRILRNTYLVMVAGKQVVFPV